MKKIICFLLIFSLWITPDMLPVQVRGSGTAALFFKDNFENGYDGGAPRINQIAGRYAVNSLNTYCWSGTAERAAENGDTALVGVVREADGNLAMDIATGPALASATGPSALKRFAAGSHSTVRIGFSVRKSSFSGGNALVTVNSASSGGRDTLFTLSDTAVTAPGGAAYPANGGVWTRYTLFVDLENWRVSCETDAGKLYTDVPLPGARNTAQNYIEIGFRGLFSAENSSCHVYYDDILIASGSYDETAAYPLPAVEITAPLAINTFGNRMNVYETGTPVVIKAEARAAGAISHMELYDGARLLAAFDGASFSYSWSGDRPGGHDMYVRAVTAMGGASREWLYLTVVENELTAVGRFIDNQGRGLHDGSFNAYTANDGQTVPAGWTGSIAYANGGRISSAASDNGTSAVQIQSTQSTKDITAYIQQTGMAPANGGALVLEMRLKRGQESNSNDLRTIISVRLASSFTYLFYMKSGGFTAWTRAEEGEDTSKGFGSYAIGSWHRVKIVMDVETARMDVYLDGVKRLENEKMRIQPGSITGLRVSHASTYATGSTVIDDVKLYTAQKDGIRVGKAWIVDEAGTVYEPMPALPVGVSQLRLGFYEPMDPTGFEAGGVRLLDDRGEVPASGEYQPSQSRYLLTPQVPLRPGTRYRIECNERLEGANGGTLHANKYWLFTTEASPYRVQGPRYYTAGGRELLSLSDLEQGDLPCALRIETRVWQTTAAPSDVTVLAAVYSGGRLTELSLNPVALEEAMTVYPVRSAVSLGGEPEELEVRVFIWDALRPVYLESLAGGKNRGTLLFQSGFEPQTAIVAQSSTIDDLQGRDLSVSGPGDWRADLEAGAVASANISYEAGTKSERYAKIIQDPTTAPQNQVLHFWQGSVQTAGKARVQMNLTNRPGVREIYTKQRVYLHEDFNLLLDYPEEITWMSFAEYWNQDGWTGKPYPYRVTLGIEKSAPGADPVTGATLYPDSFYFGVSAQKAETANFVTQWAERNTDYPVPLGEWSTWELYYREGDANTGRFIFAVTPDGGERMVIFNINGWTLGPGNLNSEGLPLLHPLKLYTSKEITSHLAGRGGALQIYWDDFEIWTPKRP